MEREVSLDDIHKMRDLQTLRNTVNTNKLVQLLQTL